MSECPIKRGNTFETGLECNFSDVHIALGQIDLGPFDSLQSQIFREIIGGGGLKDSGKIEDAETKLVGQTLQCKGLITILCDIITGLIHFVQDLG